MSLLTDKFLDDLFFNPLNWDKDFYNFNRSEKDMSPYSIVKPDASKIILVHNVLGIKKEDLDLTKKVEKGYVFLIIKGKTKDDITGKEYSINSRFHIDDTEYDLNEMTAEMKNGLLYIEIPKKLIDSAPSEVQIKIK